MVDPLMHMTSTLLSELFGYVLIRSSIRLGLSLGLSLGLRDLSVVSSIIGIVLALVRVGIIVASAASLLETLRVVVVGVDALPTVLALSATYCLISIV